MTTQYTTILKLALPVQGELSGTWGDVVNNNITQMVEQAVAGKAVINTWTGNSHTLTTADGTTSESRCAILELTDSGTALTGAGTVVCPTNTKLYIVDNNTAEIITVQTAAGTGVAVPVGKTMLVYCDGTNVVEGVTHANSLSLGTSTVTADKILDEDNMASDSATAIATQQSIKAYVDSQVGTVDTLSEILANGNTTGANDIDVDSAQKVQFRDADIYLNSSVDGQLDIVADTEIQIAATTVDLNGNLDVSGTALVTGVLTTTAATVFNGGFASNADSTLGTDKKVQFRDAAIYLNSSVDGQLDIVADGEVQIDTALVDINGNLDVSGTTNISGSVSFTKNAIAGVAISTTSRASNTVTVTTSAVHGLTSGDLVNVNGVADTSFNGYFTVSVSSTTVFTYSQTGADESSTGGTSTEVVYNLNASGTALNWMNGPLNIAANSGIDGLEITQSGAGNGLHVTGTTGLVGNTTLTGNLDVSGTTLVTGVLTTTAATVFNGGFASNADSTFGTDKKVQFRDSAIYINSSVDGQLDLVADTEIQIAATTIDVNGTLAFDSLKGTGATTVTNILDEDDMASDSATAIATQQSIKAYVDSQVGSFDTLAEVLAQGNTTGSTDIAVDSAQKVQFRDAAIYINSSVDGQLDIVADTEIQIAATTVDINGAVDVSGTLGVTGVATLASLVATTADINAGTIDGTTLGATTPASVAATTLSTTGAASLTNILLLGGTLPGAGNPSISLRSSDNVLYMQSGSANSVTILDSAQNTMQSTTATQHQWNISNVPKMTLDASGNLGLGVVPTTDHNPVVEALQIGSTANLFGRNDAETTTLTSNSYLSLAGYPKYITTNEASEYTQVSGNHIWYNAPSGTAGAACTQTERMRINATGQVGIGTSSPNVSYVLEVSGAVPAVMTSTSTVTSPMYGGLGVKRKTNANGNGTGIGFVLEDAGSIETEYGYIGGIIESNTAGSEDGGLLFATTLNNTRTERMRIDSNGNVGISTSSPVMPLDVIANAGANALSLRTRVGDDQNVCASMPAATWVLVKRHRLLLENLL
jgi:hypothetical protein